MIPSHRRQRLIAAKVGFGLGCLRLGIANGCLALGNGGFGTVALLQVVGQGCLLLLQLGNGLGQALLVNAVVQLHQQVARLDELEVAHRHIDDVTTELRADDGYLATDQGVFGAFDGTAERWQAPGIQHQQDAGQGHGSEAYRGQDAHPPRANRAARFAGGRGAFRGFGDGGGGRGTGVVGHQVGAPGVESVEVAWRFAYQSQVLRMQIQIMVRIAMLPISTNTSL